jgi:hypothetical protein
MGWDFIKGYTKRDMIDYLTRQSWVFDYRVVGRNLWIVGGDVHIDASGHAGGNRKIVLCLLDNQPGFGWGYKDMTESMGPCEVDCPEVLLNQAPVTCQSWRDKVRAYHTSQRKGRAA